MDPGKALNGGALHQRRISSRLCARFSWMRCMKSLSKFLTLNSGKEKAQALKDFQQKLGTLGFLDPACGCGNFLVVSYQWVATNWKCCWRSGKWERQKHSYGCSHTKVTINQFYGIELEEFPVEIARVSMWLMEHVMNLKFGEAFWAGFSFNPLAELCGNYLCKCFNDSVGRGLLSLKSWTTILNVTSV